MSHPSRGEIEEKGRKKRSERSPRQKAEISIKKTDSRTWTELDKSGTKNNKSKVFLTED